MSPLSLFGLEWNLLHERVADWAQLSSSWRSGTRSSRLRELISGLTGYRIELATFGWVCFFGLLRIEILRAGFLVIYPQGSFVVFTSVAQECDTRLMVVISCLRGLYVCIACELLDTYSQSVLRMNVTVAQRGYCSKHANIYTIYRSHPPSHATQPPQHPE